jgi:hypothetical protein
MSRSLIRKNQLHPDIADLISGYGDSFFVTPVELAQSLLNFQGGLPIDGIVYITGTQTISGLKNFTTRPTVNGIGVLLQGEAAGGGGTVANAVYTTGNQTIGGIKNFTSRPSLNGIGFATTGEIGGASTAFNGVRPITLQVPGFQGLQPNGDNVVTFLNNLFYPFTQANVTLVGFAVQELGTTLTDINFDVNISPGSLTFGTDIVNAIPYVSTARTPITPTPSASFTMTNVSVGSLTTTTSNVFVRVGSKNQNGAAMTIDSNIQTIYFEAPMYAGSGVLNLTSNASTLRTVLSAQSTATNNGKAVILEPGSRTVTVTTPNLGYYFFVYPDSWGALSQIKDTNFQLNFISDFTTGSIQIPLINGVNHPYRWYRNTNGITLNNYNVEYIF